MRYTTAVITDRPESLDGLHPGQWIRYGSTRGRYMGRSGQCVWIAWGKTATHRFPTFAAAFRGLPISDLV